MSGDTFTPDWLGLREPVDHRSRAHDLAASLDGVGCAAGWSRVTDLGTGTGSNLRYLAPRLSWARRWTALDHDPRVLERVAELTGMEVRTLAGDLRGAGLDAAAGAHLVTASALLDLVTEGWLTDLARVCAGSASSPALLFALSYDGTVGWSDGGVPGDALVQDAVNRHQEGEKGMGRALGPGAAPAAARILEGAGYGVTLTPSPWILSGPGDAPLALALMDGWVEAALEVLPEREAEIRRWREGRGVDVEEGRVTLRVGHTDLLALPPGMGEAG